MKFTIHFLNFYVTHFHQYTNMTLNNIYSQVSGTSPPQTLLHPRNFSASMLRLSTRRGSIDAGPPRASSIGRLSLPAARGALSDFRAIFHPLFARARGRGPSLGLRGGFRLELHASDEQSWAALARLAAARFGASAHKGHLAR